MMPPFGMMDRRPPPWMMGGDLPPHGGGGPLPPGARFVFCFFFFVFCKFDALRFLFSHLNA